MKMIQIKALGSPSDQLVMGKQKPVACATGFDVKGKCQGQKTLLLAPAFVPT